MRGHGSRGHKKQNRSRGKYAGNLGREQPLTLILGAEVAIAEIANTWDNILAVVQALGFEDEKAICCAYKRKWKHLVDGSGNNAKLGEALANIRNAVRGGDKIKEQNLLLRHSSLHQDLSRTGVKE